MVYKRSFVGYILVQATMVLDLLCHVLAIWTTLPAHSFGVNMFLEYWLSDLHMSRVMFSMIWMSASLISACFVLLTGRMVDRHGSQTTLRILYPFYAFSIVALGFVQHVIALACVLTLMRITGPEAVAIITNIATVQKHPEHTAKALSVLAWGESIFMFSPPLVLYAIQQIGWRHTIHIFSIAVVLMLLPSLCLHIPHTPKTVTETNNANIPIITYLFIIQNTVFSLFWSGFNLFVIDIMRENGFDASKSSLGVFVPLSIGFIGATLVMGCVFDRFKSYIVYMLSVVIFVLSGCMIWSLYLTWWSLWVCFFVYGWCVGSQLILYTLVFAKYAEECLARVQSIHNAFGMFATGVAPVLFSVCKEWFGVYSYMIIGISIGLVCINVMVLCRYTHCFSRF